MTAQRRPSMALPSRTAVRRDLWGFAEMAGNEVGTSLAQRRAGEASQKSPDLAALDGSGSGDHDGRSDGRGHPDRDRSGALRVDRGGARWRRFSPSVVRLRPPPVRLVRLGALMWFAALVAFGRIRDSLTEIEPRLDPARFVRVHRGEIINLQAVVRLDALFHGDGVAELDDGSSVVVSRTHRDAFFSRWRGR